MVVVPIRDGGQSAVKQVAFMHSLQPGSEYTQNCGDDNGLQGKPSSIAPFTLLNRIVSAVEAFRFLGYTIIYTGSHCLTTWVTLRLIVFVSGSAARVLAR